jgi:hypothetical protein
MKNWAIAIFCVVAFGVVSEMDFQDQCRMDKECAAKYLDK